MVAQRLYDELFALPPADQAEVLERLREHLTSTGASVELSDEVRQLLDERLAEMKHDGGVGLSRDEAFRRVAERIRAR